MITVHSSHFLSSASLITKIDEIDVQIISKLRADNCIETQAICLRTNKILQNSIVVFCEKSKNNDLNKNCVNLALEMSNFCEAALSEKDLIALYNASSIQNCFIESGVALSIKAEIGGREFSLDVLDTYGDDWLCRAVCIESGDVIIETEVDKNDFFEGDVTKVKIAESLISLKEDLLRELKRRDLLASVNSL